MEDWLELYSLLIEIPTLTHLDYTIREIVGGTSLCTLEFIWPSVKDSARLRSASNYLFSLFSTPGLVSSFLACTCMWSKYAGQHTLKKRSRSKS